MDSDNFRVPVQQVAGITQLSADDPLEEYVKDRNWFCTMFSPYFELCHEGTKIPIWCDNNSFEIFCPDDVGFEYDPATGGGGSSGGSGAGREWTQNLCFDSNMVKIPCSTKANNVMCTYYDPNIILPNGDIFYGEKVCDEIGHVCLDANGTVINCNYATTHGWKTFTHITPQGCYGGMKNTVIPKELFDPLPCKYSNVVAQPIYDPAIGISFDKQMRIVDTLTFAPVNNENLQNGVPTYVPPAIPTDPLDVEVPVGNEECGAICTWLSYIYNVMRLVNQSVLKVDSSIQQMVSNMTPKTDLLGKLDDILSAIDKVSFEIVKEAETNFWDVLGDGLGDIFDFVEFLIEKVIYLVIPEDTTNITTSFSNLSDTLNQKIKPVTDMKNTITSAVTVQDKQFENIEINLPHYGVVPFLKVDYLLMAIPFVRQMLGGSMVLMTAIWAYRKVSSEMVK